MTTIELTTKEGQKFLYQLDTEWEIYDRGDKPAHWVNYKEGRNLNAQETYDEIRKKLGLINLSDFGVPGGWSFHKEMTEEEQLSRYGHVTNTVKDEFTRLSQAGVLR